MKKLCISGCTLILIVLFYSRAVILLPQDSVTIDFTMAERCIEWLEFINTGADNKAVKEYYLKNVAPTKGCQSIIHHWARFRKWDEEEFYKFIMTALDIIPSNEEISNKDGSLTMFGRRRQLWRSALYEPDKLRKDFEQLKIIGLLEEVLQLTKKHLPPDTILENDFYVVLFGHSSAFSVGKENGFDLLQLPKREDGSIDTDEVIGTFAHELHHTGFDYWIKENAIELENYDNILLVGILAAEGMPTYFIDKPFNNLEKYKSHQDLLYRQVAADWEKHSAQIMDLYREAEDDIGLNLRGEIGQKEIMEKWMSGVKGPAYVLGAHMFSVIDQYSGHDEAVQVVSDFRQFLLLYNKAAKKANEKGQSLFAFNEELAMKISNYTGAE